MQSKQIVHLITSWATLEAFRATFIAGMTSFGKCPRDSRAKNSVDRQLQDTVGTDRIEGFGELAVSSGEFTEAPLSLESGGVELFEA